MSHSPEVKKAYGLVMAIGTKLGEKARADATLVERIRATPDLDAFRALVRAEAAGLTPDAVVASFLGLLTPADWVQWRSRLLLQLKLTRDGGTPAPGHEKGRGVGGP